MTDNNRNLVSVMMPAYNAEPFIRNAVKSLLAQTYEHWELIAVNDGSTDSTGAVLASFTDPRIKVITQVNSGEASARNTALRHIKGEFLAFLDADDCFAPDHLARTTDFLNAHPDYDGTYTDGFYIDTHGSQLKPLSARRRGPYRGDIFAQMVRSSDVFGAPLCVVLRTSVIQDHGLVFDPEIVIGPDWDFLTQFSEVGTFGYVDQCTCYYRVHQTNISLRTATSRRIQSLARCREKAVRMHRFGECPEDVRFFVFYDLLLNLLRDDPVRQNEITGWNEFIRLTAQDQGRLLRLMASSAIVQGLGGPLINEWLRRSAQCNPFDPTALLLLATRLLSPTLSRRLLQARRHSNTTKEQTSSFEDLFPS